MEEGEEEVEDEEYELNYGEEVDGEGKRSDAAVLPTQHPLINCITISDEEEDDDVGEDGDDAEEEDEDDDDA